MPSRRSDKWDAVTGEPIHLELAADDFGTLPTTIVFPNSGGSSSAMHTIGYRGFADWDVLQFHLYGMSFECDVLRGAVDNLWKTYQFNQHYIGYLAGGVSQRDFEKASEKYAATQGHEALPQGVVQQAVAVIARALSPDKLSPQDVSIILNIDTRQLQLAFEPANPNAKKTSELGR